MRVKPGADTPAAPTGDVAAILLAAGLSRRMGETNKLLIEIDGAPMVRRAATALAENGLSLYVVVGHEHAYVEQALSGLPATIIFNANYREGQASSMRAGVDALASHHCAALIALADQPSLDATDISALLTAYQNSDQNQIMMPVFDGQRGNPIIVPRAILEAIGQGSVNFGCRKFMDENPARIVRYEAQNDHFTRDVDTVEALAAYAG